MGGEWFPRCACGETALGRGIPCKGGAFGLVVAVVSVEHTDLFAVVEKGCAGKGEQDLGGVAHHGEILSQAGHDADLVVVAEERGPTRDREVLRLLEDLPQGFGGHGGDSEVDRISEREMEGEIELIAFAVFFDGCDIAPNFADQDSVVAGLLDVFAEVSPIIERFGLVALELTCAIGDDVTCRIKAVSVYTCFDPLLGDGGDLFSDRFVLKVEIGHSLPKDPVVVGITARMPYRTRTPRLRPSRIVVSPHIPRAIRRLWIL